VYVPELVVTADVQPERLTKAYHRAWHAENGAWTARMKLEEMFEKNGALRAMPVNAPALFGTPGFLYRQLIASAGRCAVATILGRESQALTYENHVRQLVRYIETGWRATKSGKKRTSPAAQLLRFGVAVVRRKLAGRGPKPPCAASAGSNGGAG
jgi:hypothetical protein